MAFYGMEPLLAALVAVGLLPMVHRRLAPTASARVLVAATSSLGVAGFLTVAVVAGRFLAHVAFLEDALRWCAVVVGHKKVTPFVGLPAVGAVVIGSVRAVRLLRSWRRLRPVVPTGEIVVDSDRVFAYSLPGRHGATLLSSALLGALNDLEQQVVREHEAAHHRHRHDRYLLAAHLSERLVPVLRPLARRVEFSVERWADEAAAVAVGGDRRLVARTIARVALVAERPRRRVGAVAFVGLGASARARAILAAPAHRLRWVAVAYGSAAVTVAMAAYQVHHVERLAQALCRV